MMEIVCTAIQLKERTVMDFGRREVEESAVIRLEFNGAPVGEDLVIAGKKLAGGEASCGMS